MTWLDTVISACRKKKRVSRPFRPVAGSSRAERKAHECYGRHLLATYLGCDPAALRDRHGLLGALESAATASGATVLKSADHVFPPHGLTAVILLSESHASIHTYPEQDACFVDLFTCGRDCSADRFDILLRDYLHPVAVHRRVLVRRGGYSPEVPGARETPLPGQRSEPSRE